MIHRTIFWEVIPLMTVVIFDFLDEVLITSKWAWLICTIVIGLCAIEAGIENACIEAKPDGKRQPMVFNILCWILALPMVMFIVFTLFSVFSDIFILVYVLMLVVSVIFINIICAYAKHIWNCIKGFEEEVIDEY